MAAVEFRKQVQEIPLYMPGMPLEEARRRFNLTQVIKLASNECPLGPFPAVKSKIVDWVEECHRYPDNDCFSLLKALNRTLDVPAESILIGNGSVDIIAQVAVTLFEPGDEVVIPWPTFPYYDIAATLCGATTRRVPLRADFTYDMDALLAAITPRTKLVVVCNPNNPTGTYVAEREFRAFIDAVPESVLIIADEAYYEYVTAEDYATLIDEAQRRKNLLVARTFSKIYGLAGMRIGYAVVHTEVGDQVRKARGPFSVNTLAQMAATESVGYPEIVRERRRLNAEWRSALCDALNSAGYKFAASQANFVMTKLGENSETIMTEFLRRGIILRPGTADGWMRVSVGTPDENQRFLEALADIDLKR